MKKLDILLPCPFCGKKPIVEEKTEAGPAIVYCANQKCAVVPECIGSTKELAVRGWNGRKA